MSRTIVIGGGTGFVGSALTRKLTQKGYEILHVSRAAKPGHLTWDAVTQAYVFVFSIIDWF
jgi:nucleoside-diphosphate-sugar epimerase